MTRPCPRFALRLTGVTRDLAGYSKLGKAPSGCAPLSPPLRGGGGGRVQKKCFCFRLSCLENILRPHKATMRTRVLMRERIVQHPLPALSPLGRGEFRREAQQHPSSAPHCRRAGREPEAFGGVYEICADDGGSGSVVIHVQLGFFEDVDSCCGIGGYRHRAVHIEPV